MKYKDMVIDDIVETAYNLYDFNTLFKIVHVDNKDIANAKLWDIIYDIQDYDSVTGNNSGAYALSQDEAKRIFENAEDSTQLLNNAMDNDNAVFFTSRTVAKDLLNGDYMDLDVLIRLYVIETLDINEVKHRLGKYLHNN